MFVPRATRCGGHENTWRPSVILCVRTVLLSLSHEQFLPNFYETYIIGSNFKDTYCPWTEKYVQRGGH